MERTILWHSKHILVRNFELRHQVLLSRWSCFFNVMQVFPHEVVEIKDEKSGAQFKINAQRLSITMMEM